MNSSRAFVDSSWLGDLLPTVAAASLLPARRAARLDPAMTLRRD
jgi:ABC-type lipoprotein release transport system permease subunit